MLWVLPGPSDAAASREGLPAREVRFTHGEAVRVTVAEVHDDGRVVIVVKGTPFRASTRSALQAGHVIQARVELVDGRVVLRPDRSWPGNPGPPTQGLTAVADPLGDILRTLLPFQEPVAAVLARLAQAVRRARLSREIPEQTESEFEALRERLLVRADDVTGARIKEALLAMGLQHERGLLAGLPQGAAGATLKGWLLAALAGPLSDELSGEAQTLLRVIERSQVVNAVNAQTGQPVVFELPLAWGDASCARIFVEARDTGRGPEPGPGRTYSVVTLLELDGIGAVRVNLSLTGRRLAASILVERPDVERAVAACLPALNRGLTAQGYDVGGLSAAVGQPATLRGEDVQARAAPTRQLVNVCI